MDEHAVWTTRRPGPELAGIIGRYVGYRMTGFPAGLHRGLPSGHLAFIVSIGPPIDVVSQTNPRHAARRYDVVVGGLHSSPALIAHDGHQEGIAVELTPLGSRALLGMPARELWNTSLELDEVVGPAGRELWERIQEAPGWDARFAALDGVLGRLLRDDTVDPALARAWQLVTASEGATSVSELAGRIGWTRQHLARRFSGEFGLSPKLASRIVRFQRARRMLARTPAFVSIAQVAATCGYYDQAHLTRDFVALAGAPPGRLLTEDDLPSFQDSDE